MNLVVEIGNTALKAAWTEKTTLGKILIYQGERPVDFICGTRFKALNRYSRNLPLLGIPEETDEIGVSLQSSIHSGIISGIMFEIQGYLEKKPENIVVFTGGDANYFVKKMKNSIFVVCNLVMIGLAIIADEYVREENN